eukprot:11947536-Ditylum_brightwellii.AAC.1
MPKETDAYKWHALLYNRGAVFKVMKVETKKVGGKVGLVTKKVKKQVKKKKNHLHSHNQLN